MDIKYVDYLIEKVQEPFEQSIWFNETVGFILQFVEDLFDSRSSDRSHVGDLRLSIEQNPALQSKNDENADILNYVSVATIFFTIKEYFLAEEYFKRGFEQLLVEVHKKNKCAKDDELQGIICFYLAKIQMEKMDFIKSNEYFLKGFRIFCHILSFDEIIEYLIHWSYLFVEASELNLAESIFNLLESKKVSQTNQVYTLLMFNMFKYKRISHVNSAMTYAELLLSCPLEFLDNDEWYTLHLFCGEYFANENKDFKKSIYHFTMANSFLSNKWKEYVKQISMLQDIVDPSEYLKIKKTYEDKMLEIILENNLHNNLYITSLKHSHEELQQAHNKVREYSFTDSLTQLHNRRYLWEKIDDFLGLVMREKVPLSCFVLDFDDFKKINDNFGHIEGDKVLRSSCKVIKSFFKSQDLVIRFGGEEILVLLFDVDAIEAEALAENLRKKIEELEIVSENNIIMKITVSIGISTVSESFSHIQNILDKMIMEADKSMYLAKANGKNRTYRGLL